MADNYDFKKMFSQDSGQMEENDFRACNTLFMANALGQPEADISNGYENVIENFTGEKAPSSEAVFNQIWGMIEDKDRAISPWTSQISEAIGAEEPPVYNGGFWNEVGRRATEGLAMGEARSKSILGSAVDLIPSMTRGFGTLVTQIGEAVGIADEQQEFFDDIMSNPFIATMLATPSQFITESGEFNKQAKAEMRELSKEYGKPAVVFDELYTSVLDTMIYLQAMKLGGMQIGGTPSQAAGAELSTQMTSRLVAAGKLGAFKGVFSEANSLQERADIASVTAMYMSTPAASGLFESGKSVFLADLMMNTAITTPQVNELWERDDIDDFDKILETVKMVGSDVVFSAMTKTMRGNRLSPNWKPMQEASRQLIKDEKNAEHRANFSKVSEAYNDPKKVPKPGFLLNRVEGEADKATQAGKGFINAEAAKTQSAKDIDDLQRTLMEQEKVTTPEGREVKVVKDEVLDDTGKPAEAPIKPTPAEPGAKETLTPPKPIEPSQASQRRKVLLDTITRTAEMNIDKRVDEINRTMQDLENGVPPREVTSRVKQRVNRATGVTKQPGTIRVNEYQMLKKQIRDYNKGAKAGKQLGKKAEKARVAEREAKIADIRRIAADYARSQIHSKDLLDSVKNTIGKITADTQLNKALAKIDERVAEQKHRDAVKGVDKELKKLKKMKLHPTQQKNVDALLDGIATTKTSDKKLGSLLSSKKFFEAEVRFENELPDYLNKAIEGLEDKQLRDLTTEDLNVLKMGIQRIRSNQELREELTERGQRRKIEKWATDFDATVRGDSPLHRFDKEGYLKDPKKGGVLGALNKLDLNPDGQAFIIDGGREGIAHQVFVKNFWAGDDKRLALEQHASRYMEPHHDMIKGWDKSDISTQIGDKKVKISRGERIAIYLDSLNPQNESHQLGGGYVLRSNPGIPLKMTADQRDKIIDGMTAEDFKVAQTIQDGYQNILRPALNETSVKVIGHEIAVIDNYHPMSSARMFMDSGDGKIMPSDLKSFSEYLLGSSGHFKERTVGAKNPIVLQDAIKKYDQMVSLISKYHGYAEPLRDAKQFLDGKTANGDPVRQVIASTSGTKYNEMMDDLLKDLEGGYEKSTRGWLRKSNAVLNKATNKIVRGILGHNIKVAGLQPVSYATAKNVVPMKYWAEGLKSSPASWDEMAEHSPLMWDRGKGHLSIAFGESTKEKRANRGMQMIRTMDRNAVGRIWRAYEAMGRDEGNGTIDYKKVAERTNDAVRRTQPTFEIIDRPAIARTDNVVYRSLSMFTSQRNKNHTLKLKNDVGMFGKLKDGTATDKDWKEWGNKTVINRIIVPSLVAGYQAAWAMAMGKKYEDDERTVLNRFGNKYIDSQLSEAGPLAGSILAEVKAVIAGLDDSVEGREVSSALIKTWKNLERDVGAVADAIKLDDEILFAEDREKVDEKRAKAIESLLRNIAIASGRGEYHYYDYAKMIQSWTEEDGELSFEQN